MFSQKDWKYIKLMLIARGSSRSKALAKQIVIHKPVNVAANKPREKVKAPMKPSTKPYKTEPDYPPVK